MDRYPLPSRENGAVELRSPFTISQMMSCVARYHWSELMEVFPLILEKFPSLPKQSAVLIACC